MLAGPSQTLQNASLQCYLARFPSLHGWVSQHRGEPPPSRAYWCKTARQQCKHLVWEIDSHLSAFVVIFRDNMFGSTCRVSRGRGCIRVQRHVRSVDLEGSRGRARYLCRLLCCAPGSCLLEDRPTSAARPLRRASRHSHLLERQTGRMAADDAEISVAGSVIPRLC